MVISYSKSLLQKINPREKQKSVKKALINLGKINEFEKPLILSINSLYKYDNRGKQDEDFKNLCASLNLLDYMLEIIITIIRNEDKYSKKQVEWFFDSKEKGISKINVYLNLYSIYPKKDERLEFKNNCSKIRDRVKRICTKEPNSVDIEKTIYFLDDLLSHINQSYETEKNLYEKMITGNSII